MVTATVENVVIFKEEEKGAYRSLVSSFWVLVMFIYLFFLHEWCLHR